jgi:thiosulfate/3-mercaptopyruvate sulfurtransferase
MTRYLVTPEWLNERLGQPGFKVVDGSWYLPDQNRDAKAEFRDGHIPGAVYFDIDEIVDGTSDLPHTMPNAASFAEDAGALGLSETDTIVVYDGMGIFSAARVWWMLRTFGAKEAYVLDGGLPAWRAAGLPLEVGETLPETAAFHPRFDANAMADLDVVATALESATHTVVDARSAPRFRGEAPEPRPGIRAGHMPGARNVHYASLTDAVGKMRTPAEIEKAFREAGVDLSSPVITTCGSGVTAATLLLALAQLGKDDVRVYDGSWTEWGGRPDSPVVTGDA